MWPSSIATCLRQLAAMSAGPSPSASERAAAARIAVVQPHHWIAKGAKMAPPK